MTKLKVSILVQPGDEEEYVEELKLLAKDSEPPIIIRRHALKIYHSEGKVEFIFTPEQLTDRVDYIIGHAAALLKGERLPPEELEEKGDK